MKRSDSVHRFAYYKRSDVVDELIRNGPNPKNIPEGGPDHYVATFLQWTSGYPVLLISNCDRNASVKCGEVRAQVFKSSASLKNPVTGILDLVMLFFKTLFHLLMFRPTWILCASSGIPLWACFVASRLCSVPLVHTRHNRVEAQSGPWLKRFLIRVSNWIIRRASVVICHGPYLERQLRGVRVDPKRLFQFNLSYKYLLQPLTNSEEIPDLTERKTKTCILFVGRIDMDKGVFDLLEAISPRLEQNHNLNLVYVGDGPHLQTLRNEAARRTTKHQVKFMGHTDHRLIPAMIRQCRFVVTPSRAALPEGRPKAATEAIVLGRPVIAPNSDPFPYLIEHGRNGLFFEPESVTDLRAKIVALLDDLALYERLAAGAEQTGRSLMEPSTSFVQALDNAYSLSTAKT
jgi:glycosyltransferase involved in cell wall biosynthesis